MKKIFLFIYAFLSFSTHASNIPVMKGEDYILGGDCKLKILKQGRGGIKIKYFTAEDHIPGWSRTYTLSAVPGNLNLPDNEIVVYQFIRHQGVLEPMLLQVFMPPNISGKDRTPMGFWLKKHFLHLNKVEVLCQIDDDIDLIPTLYKSIF